MRTTWLTLAAFCVTVGAALPTSAQSSSAGPPGGGSYPDYGGAAGLAGAPAAVGIQLIAPTYSRGAFSLAEAYPCAAGSYPAAQGIADLQCFAGRCPAPGSVPGAVPGVLCLRRRGLVLDVNCFAVVPEGQVGPCTVQSYSLIITVPGSQRCPDVYGAGGHTYFQLGSGVRTWWCLSFSPPGTVFTLSVVSACQLPLPGGRTAPGVHQDVWSWQVVADVHTMASLIELMHTGAISTLEVPCILGEDMYDALKAARLRLETALASAGPSRPTEIQNAFFDFEALIIANCLFTEALKPLEAFKGPDQFGAANLQPPGNPGPTVPLGEGGTAVAGIIDTTDHPCCCKLLVDLERIAQQNQIAEPGTGAG